MIEHRNLAGRVAHWSLIRHEYFELNLKEGDGGLYINRKLARYDIETDTLEGKIFILKAFIGELIRRVNCPGFALYSRVIKLKETETIFILKKKINDIRIVNPAN